ncbi:hypothetical protein ECG_08115 [Echinococcus granulosus]|uniref:Uncharacterized protein n=1 Tax=Echinococcus granulosus TaxID=6210 RepID=W6U7P9_ECHGR|nr:hypothetical protein EGR_08751 [Echinococcus granulosus]EUB56381.1 hypothetical protein EGR_08751 [Echinococcus granulosus]KAH9279310.1 hypothetical protein ECG_08115 [Echinococcus granulosus]
MRASAISAVLLVFAIVQTQAFFTLLDSELLLDRERRPSDVGEREAEEPVESEAAAEHHESGEAMRPAEVTQRDVTLLRRDILISLERLRRTIERLGHLGAYWPTSLRYPGQTSGHHPHHPSSKQ